jgi:DNA topoisomerase I
MKLIISEKAIAGKKIASILSKNKFTTVKDKGVDTFKFKFNNDDCLLIPLRGHINKVDFVDENSYWSIFNLDLLADKEFIYKEVEKRIISLLKEKRKDLNEIIIATDADREGEAIGLEAYNYVKTKNSTAELKRAYFSALTDKEVNDAFSKFKQLDFNYAYSVFARQEIDLLWGAILTRYLSVISNRKGKLFLSAGRVQTPLLNFIVEKELEREKFVAEKYRVLRILFEKDKIKFEGTHKENKMFDVKKADLIFEKIKDAKEGIVTSVLKSEKILKKPEPFNTTSFLRSASAIGIGTTTAMNTAESLYQKGIISYPRTDNTVYPSSLDLKEILEKIGKLKEYEKDVKEILKKPLKPSRGKKETTDHPPIHPVDVAGDLSGNEQRIYDLVVRRFLATLSIDAKTENLSVVIEVLKEPFMVNGQIILEPGWKKIYIYSKLNEVILPPLEKGNIVDIKDKFLDKKVTTPPPRYTEGGLIKLMEEQNLGTKSTRPSIIQKLRDRGYLKPEKQIEPTKIAISVCSVLNKHADIITKPKLTADTEEEMEKIATGKKEKVEVVNETRKILHEIIKILLKEKDDIAKELREGISHNNYIGKCNKCGKKLIIRHGRTGKQFVACSGFPACRNTFPLPQNKVVAAIEDTFCEVCKSPMIKVSSKRGKTYDMCLNHKCPTKNDFLKKMKDDENNKVSETKT